MSPRTKSSTTVKDVMTSKPVTCTPDTTVAAAAHLMWEADCGILPVVDDDRLVGVVTDRDLYIALATRDVRASDLRIGTVARKEVVTCQPDADVHSALTAMQNARVRRLPVVDGGRVVGVISMNDVVLAVRRGSDITEAEVLDVLQSVCAHHHAPAVMSAA